MNALLGLVFVAVAAGAIAWLVAHGRRAERRADFDRAVRARKLGWRYDGRRNGRIDYRFAGGRDGIDWTMWYDSDRGDDSPTPRAHWSTENVRAPRLSLVILGRRRYALESGTFGRLLMGVVSGIVGAADGRAGVPDKVAFYESAVLLDEGRDGPGGRLAVAVAPDMPRAWLDDDLARHMAKWPAGRGARTFRADDALEVNLGPQGLAITVQKMPTGMTDWQHLADLGERLAGRLVAAQR